MAGIWTNQNKVLPGAYINFKTNSPLSIQIAERGIVALLLEVVEGTKGEVYTATLKENNLPEGASVKLINEALKGSNKVIVYNLGTAHTLEDVKSALKVLETLEFNVLSYPFKDVTEGFTSYTTIVNWVQAMRDEEGIKITTVLPNHVANKEFVVNVVQGVQLAGYEQPLTVEETSIFVAGVTAGAGVAESNTGRIYPGAIDVIPRMKRSEMETAVQAGKFIFKVDNAQNVTCVYDINSLTSVSESKGEMYRKNRLIRTIDNVATDIDKIFESRYKGKVDNSEEGRNLFKADLLTYFAELKRYGAIEEVEAEDITIEAGINKDSILVKTALTLVDAIEKVYIDVQLS